MAKQVKEDLASFLKRQNPEVLVAVLLELAGQEACVSARLARLQLADQPDKLAAGFRKTLAAWRRSKKFISYRDSRAFAQTLEDWLLQVEQELLPKHPPAALALFEAFVEADASWFDRSDDSGGYIGEAVRAACLKWLEAASRCESPAYLWPERLKALYSGDAYGPREALLQHADLLLNEAAMRQLVADYEQDMSAELASVDGAKRTTAGWPSGVYKASSALSLLSEALHDPDVRVRSVCSYSPQPNGLQKEDFVKAFLKENRPEDALLWLQDSWGHHDVRRQSLLSDALARLGRGGESAQLRLHMFETSLASHDYQRWLALLPEADHPQAHEKARQRALAHSEPVVAAGLLLTLDEAHDAQDKLIEMADAVDGQQYETLPVMAKALLAQHCYRGATVVYRALLNNILQRANSVAYGHAARYWWKLNEIAALCDTLSPLPSGTAYEEAVRMKHMRKLAFWARVNELGQRLLMQGAHASDEQA